MIDPIGIPLSAYLGHQQKVLAVERFVDLVFGYDVESYARQHVRVMQRHLFRVRLTNWYQVIRVYGYEYHILTLLGLQIGFREGRTGFRIPV